MYIKTQSCALAKGKCPRQVGYFIRNWFASYMHVIEVTMRDWQARDATTRWTHPLGISAKMGLGPRGSGLEIGHVRHSVGSQILFRDINLFTCKVYSQSCDTLLSMDKIRFTISCDLCLAALAHNASLWWSLFGSFWPTMHRCRAPDPMALLKNDKCLNQPLCTSHNTRHLDI